MRRIALAAGLLVAAVDRSFAVVVSYDRRPLEASGLAERVRAPAADAQE